MTPRGRWALRLDGAGAALVVVSAAIVALTEVSVVGVLALLGLVAVIAGGVLAALAIVRDHERSWLVEVTLAPALVALFLVIGELAFPH